MKLSNAEKLAILVTASCRPDLKDQFVNVKKVAEWVSQGDEWAISWKYDWFESEPHPKDSVVLETKNIFDMFRHIQKSESSEVEAAGLNIDDLIFQGFDANNGDHHYIAEVMVNQLGRYTDLRGAELNSHSIASLPRYRKRLEKYIAVINRRPVAQRNDQLLAAELKEIFSN